MLLYVTGARTWLIVFGYFVFFPCFVFVRFDLVIRTNADAKTLLQNDLQCVDLDIKLYKLYSLSYFVVTQLHHRATLIQKGRV